MLKMCNAMWTYSVPLEMDNFLNIAPDFSFGMINEIGMINTDFCGNADFLEMLNILHSMWTYIPYVGSRLAGRAIKTK